MKNLLACLAVFAAFSVSAQQYSPPWNPDADDNGSIGATDVLATLSVYGNDWGIDTSLTCDYVPNDSEQWFIDVLSGVIVVDSMVVQIAWIDVQSIYVLGCPNPVQDTAFFELTSTLTPTFLNVGSTAGFQDQQNGPQNASADFSFYNGYYCWSLAVDHPTMSEINYAGFYLQDYWDSCEQLPLSGLFSLSPAGIEAENWGANTEYFQVVPYWHYAE